MFCLGLFVGFNMRLIHSIAYFGSLPVHLSQVTALVVNKWYKNKSSSGIERFTENQSRAAQHFWSQVRHLDFGNCVMHLQHFPKEKYLIAESWYPSSMPWQIFYQHITVICVSMKHLSAAWRQSNSWNLGANKMEFGDLLSSLKLCTCRMMTEIFAVCSDNLSKIRMWGKYRGFKTNCRKRKWNYFWKNNHLLVAIFFRTEWDKASFTYLYICARWWHCTLCLYESDEI